MVLRVAITGGIACGKSVFSRTFVARGVEVLDTDEVAHRLEASGGSAVPLIAAAFGRSVLACDGGIDRRALGEIVFGDVEKRLRLNELIHPLVRMVVAEWLARPGAGIRAVVVPLLFEVGWQDDWDVIVCLVSSEEVQVRRLVEHRGLSLAEARVRVFAQMPVSEKAARSHVVVDNSADVSALAREAERVYRLLVEKMA